MRQDAEGQSDKVLTQIRNAGVVSRWLLVMYANGLALGDRAESVRVAVAAAVSEFAAGARARFVIIFVESTSARAGLHGEVAHV